LIYERFLIVCALWAGVYRAADTTQANSHSELTGKVTYLERMLLPRAANLRIILFDTDDPANPSVILEKVIPTEGRQIPIPFKVHLARGSINARRSYSVKAELIIGGRLWFTTRKPIPVLTKGNPHNITIVLEHSP
jgi:putative lipoprotein